jgi:homeobox-leucine zipper protein
MYAPMALATARDFWTLRYTCLLEDGNFVVSLILRHRINPCFGVLCYDSIDTGSAYSYMQVCEGSLATGQGMQEMPNSSGFVRAEMLASGVLIRPCEQGGSVVMAIDDMNFMVSDLSLIFAFFIYLGSIVFKWLRKEILVPCLCFVG